MRSFNEHDALGDCKATLHIFNKIVSDDSFPETSEIQYYESVSSKSAYNSQKKSGKRGRLILAGFIILVVGILGVLISSRIISGGFGFEYIFAIENFKNYFFDGALAVAVIGLLIIVLTIRSVIKSLGK